MPLYFKKKYEMQNNDMFFLQRAVKISAQNVSKGGGPFGAVIVENNKILAEAGNNVTNSNDPTAHAEIEAIRLACNIKKTFLLDTCTIYSSCEPCPMCLSAIYWSKISRIVFAASRHDAAQAGFTDAFLYNEIQLPISKRAILTSQITIPETTKIFKNWTDSLDKITY